LKETSKIYRLAFSVHPGKAIVHQDRYRLHRIMIGDVDGCHIFRNKLTTGYSGTDQKLTSGLRDYLFQYVRLKDGLARFFDIN